MLSLRLVTLSLFSLSVTANAQSIFPTPIPVDQLIFIKQFVGQPSSSLIRD